MSQCMGVCVWPLYPPPYLHLVILGPQAKPGTGPPSCFIITTFHTENVIGIMDAVDYGQIK